MYYFDYHQVELVLNDILFFRKPRTKRGKRILLKKEPKVVENTKHCVFIPGRKSSLTVSSCMKDLVSFIENTNRSTYPIILPTVSGATRLKLI